VKPKIGFVVPGGVSTPEMREKALAQLSTLNMDVRAIEGFPARKAEVLQAADRLRKDDVDGFILYQPGISSEEAGCLLASELRDYPMLLWARWGSPSEGFNLPLAGLFSQASNIKRLGKDFFTFWESRRKHRQRAPSWPLPGRP